MRHRTPTRFVSLTPLSAAILAVGFLVFAIGGCAHIDGEDDEEAAIVVPSAATSAPEYRGDGSIPNNRPVVRMSDGQRDWEIEIPDTARGYEMRIPLREEHDVHDDYQALTDADRELIDHLRRTDPEFEREGVYVDGEHTSDREARRQLDDPEAADDAPDGEAEPAPTRTSYFRGIDRVQRFFEAGHYEQAMIHLANLERDYPTDERIKSMKGTLWLELGREQLARDSWEQVLQINPDNEPVREALQRLDTDVSGDVDEEEALEELEEELE